MKFKCRMSHNLDRAGLSPKTVKGSALVITIFIIVVMTLIGTALVKTLSTSAETVVYEVLGTRALQAAQTGLQQQLQRIFPLKPATGACIDISNVDLSATSGLEHCKIIEATCDDSVVVSGNKYYTITSTGECEVAGVFTSRSVEVQARDL